MPENKLNCESITKEDDESRWLCFTRSTIMSFLITLFSCFFGLVYLYYKNLYFEIKNTGDTEFELNDFNPFPTHEKMFFPNKYFDDKSNIQEGGNSTYKCSVPINKSIDLTSFPYNLPNKETEFSFKNMFAHFIYETSKMNNLIYGGVISNLIKFGDNKLINIMLLLFGWLIGLILFVSSIPINIFVPIYSYIVSLTKFSSSKLWQILTGIGGFLLGIPFIVGVFGMFYYPFKLLYKLSFKPYFDQPAKIIDIITCNRTIIAYLLTSIIVSFGWSHLSLTVASVMSAVWFLLFVKELYYYFKYKFIHKQE